MNPLDLPLESNRTFVAGGVSFAVDVGDGSPAFFVTRAALDLYFGTDADAAPDDAQAALSAFDRHVHQSHRLARDLWRHRGPDAASVVMTVDAVFRALTRS